LILADTLIQFAIRPEGWIHSVHGDFDVPRGPVGVLFYLVFVPLFWIVPRRWRAHYLTVTSLMLTVATVGPAFTITLAVLAVIGWAIIRTLARGQSYWIGLALLVVGYATLILYPQPAWLPPVHEPLYFYVHWAGLGYMFLRTVHVLNDVSRLKLSPPGLTDWLAYLLFAPTLRMGPIFRYRDFVEQMRGELARERRLVAGAGRLLNGMVRLAAVAVLIDKNNFPLDVLFNDPGQLSAGAFIFRIYLAPFSFFLWISGYVELSIGIGRLMGFVVPENFNYPWSSSNIAEFWQRWHITLGAWLRDYVFTPMVRRRWHYFWAFTVTFLLCGLWHGNCWCYVIWGTAQGVGLAVLRVWGQFWKQQHSIGSPLYRRLVALRLVGSPVSTVLAWLLTLHYEVITILIGMDIEHAGLRVAARALELIRTAAGF